MAGGRERDQGKGTKTERGGSLLPALTLPRGGGALRGIGEKFRTNAATGTVSLTIPIPLPQARGIEPGISLGYDSGAGASLFGMGGRLSLLTVTRRLERSLPRYDESDVFLLAGAEELVPRLAKGSDGAFAVESFASGDHRVRRYRPRVEGPFARIERWTHRGTGEMHWEVTDRDNKRTILGRSAEARIADPRDPKRVLSWLPEEASSDRGDIVRYEYKAEDGVGVDRSKPSEGPRLRSGACFAERYLKRVLFGNRRPGEATDWLFELVFDFGDHDPETPRPAPDRPWPVRHDPFSDFRPGFDLRTWRLCWRALLFHHMAELGSEPCLVRSTDFTYEEGPSVTYLRAVTEVGYVRRDDGTYERKALPPLELDYTRAEIHDEAKALDAEKGEVPGAAGPNVSWDDIDSEGIPGALIAERSALWYRRNLGGGKLAPAVRLPSHPAPLDLATGLQQIMDLEGNGKKCIVEFGGPLSGYAERTAEGGWEPAQSFRSLPTIDWKDPNLRFLDVDNDGRPELLIAEHEAFVWYPSKGKEGFGQGISVPKAKDENKGPTIVFADQDETIFLADMTGSGLVDIVRVRNSDISYWPNLGYGRFGPKVNMDRAPRLDVPDQFNARRVRLADIDGSGTADLIYAGREGITIYFNQAGNGWSEGRRIRSLPLVDNMATFSVVDLLGTGTACLVWASLSSSWGSKRALYVDLLGGVKPHLLSLVRNNMGGETHITYASSTRFYLEDRARGRPWITRLPFPVHVVERVETVDAVTRTRLLTRYRYRHGYFDPYEREFRGFAIVEQWDAESFDGHRGAVLFVNEGSAELRKPPIYRKTFFHTGVWLHRKRLERLLAEECYAADATAPRLEPTKLPPGLSVREEREACRALRGCVLREEVYAEDGTSEAAHPYTVSMRNYALLCLQNAPSDGASGRTAGAKPPTLRGEAHAVFLVHSREEVGLQYERRPNDPRIHQELTLAADAWGNVTKRARIAYPRRVPTEPEEAQFSITIVENDVANRVTERDGYRVGVPVASREWELTGIAREPGKLFSPEGLLDAFRAVAEIPYEATASGTAPERRLIEREEYLYHLDDLAGPLPLGEVGTRALRYESYKMALTRGLVAEIYGVRVTDAILRDEAHYVERDRAWWVPSGRAEFDPAQFYLPIRFFDPFGEEHSVVYDRYALLAIEAHEPLGGITRAEPDYRVLQPWLMTDENGNQNAVGFDALGMVVKTAVMGKGGVSQGDTLDDPTMRLEYNLSRFHEEGRPCFVRTFARERHGAENPRFQETYTYFDGLGREVMKKVQAEPGLAPARDAERALVRDAEDRLVLAHTNSRWVGTGRTVFDNKGNAVKKYQPFFSSTPEYEDESDLVESGITPIFHYDPLNRLVRTDYPDGTFSHVVFDAWEEARWDQNDTVAESAWLAARQRLPADDPERRAATLALAHACTPGVAHVDPAGRTFLAVADNGPVGRYATRTTLDIEGNERKVTDARNVETVRQRFDMLGQKIHVVSADAGESRTLLDVAGKPIRSWTARDYAIRRRYDARQRPTHLFVQAPGAATERLAELTVYGESHPEAAERNLRGKVFKQFHGAGVTTHERHDFKGNLLVESKRLLRAYRAKADWSPLAELADPGALDAAAALLLEHRTFVEERQYDALNRVTSLLCPDKSEIRPGYNEANLLERLDVRLRGQGGWLPIVTGIDYDARGKRLNIAYGNGVETAYEYEPLTLRLARKRTIRARDGARLQDLRYTRDPVGNIVEIRDGAQQSELFGSPPESANGRYVYDALYRLIEAEGREHPGQQPTHEEQPRGTIPHPNDIQALRRYVERYLYDETGNLLRMSHEAGANRWTRRYEYADGSNRLLRTSMPGDDDGERPSGVYDHDAGGNMTRMPHLADMRWDFADRLESVDLGGGGTAFYAYDAGGQRVRKVIERQGGLIEERIYLGPSELYRRRFGENVEVERETLHVMDDEQRVALVETKTRDEGSPVAAPESRIRYQLDNHLGSSVLEVDEAGLIISYEEFFPFGGTSYHAARAGVEVSARRFRYNGKERDEETGLYYYGARYYAPWLGRWTSADPAGFVDGLNLYAYCRGNPLRYSDRTGTQSVEEQVIRVPERPKGLPANVTRWAYSAGGGVITGSEQQFGELTRGKQVFVFDPSASKENLAQLRKAEQMHALEQMTGAMKRALEGSTAGGSGTADGGNKATQQLALAAGIANQMLNEEIKPREGSSPHGIVGGRNLGGSSSPALQAAASAGQILAGLVAAAVTRALRRAMQLTGALLLPPKPGVATAKSVATESKEIVRQADELLEQAITHGPEVVSGFRIYGNKGLVGNVFNRNILLIEAEKKGAAPLRALLNAFEAEARAAGASQISITGHAVINPGFTPRLAERFGYGFRQINSETIELTKVLTR